MKKKWLIVLCCILIILLSGVVILFINGNKSPEEIAEIIRYNDYKYYYNYGGNTYNSQNKCYDLDDDTERECVRETKYNQYVYIDLINKQAPGYVMRVTINYYGNYIIDSADLGYEYSGSEYELGYTYYEDKSKEYLTYSLNDENVEYYYKLIKYDEDNNFNKVTKTQEEKLDKFYIEFKNKLKELKLNKQEIINYGKWIFEEEIVPQIKKSKETLQEGVTYAYMIDALKDFQITEEENKLFMTDGYNYIAFEFKNRKLTGAIYSYEGSDVYLLIKDGRYNVMDNENTCTYDVVAKQFDLIEKKGRIEGTCSDDMITNMKVTIQMYEFLILDSRHILQEELDVFVTKLYYNNK